MFENTFYIMETSPGWFQARMTKTHFCFSAGGDLQKRLDGITRLVAKFRTEQDILMTHLGDDGSCSNHMSLATREQHAQQYSERGHLYDDDIMIAVQKGLKMKQEKDPINKARKRASLIKKTHLPLATTVEPVVKKPHLSLPTKVKKEVVQEKEPEPVVKKGILVKKINRTI